MDIIKKICIGIVLCICTVSGALFYAATHTLVDLSILENYDPGSYSVVLDDQGNEFTRFQLDKREPISLDALSPYLIEAFLAAEDQNFFVHHGISYKGIIRSFFANFFHGKIVQGASTITQQLIKLLFLDNSRTFKRKIKELFLALIVEHQLSKEHILQTYLNHIYLGCGIYGVEAASQRFWQKSARALTVAQAATLAGIVQSPERLCPLVAPEKTVLRRNSILKKMVRQKRITREVYENAISEPITIYPATEECCAPHIKEMIRQHIESLVGKKELYSGGLTIQTTISQKLQKESNRIFKRHLQAHQKRSEWELDGGFFIFEGNYGKIKALIGSKDFATSQFNRVTQARRQLGSIFKPLIFCCALEQGARMDDICTDEPITIESNGTLWSPQNYNHMFQGPVTRAYGLYKSLNTIAVQTLHEAGVHHVINTAHRCGITQEIPPYPSLALGCVDGTLWQAARMFNCFAQQGMLIEPYYLEWVKNKAGKKIYKHTPSRTCVLSWHATSQVARVLEAGITQMRKKYSDHSLLQTFNVPFFGKTGTTNDARSCFFIGSTPRYTAAAYLGNDENKPMGTYTFASQTVFPLVLEILKMAPHQPEDHFVYHPDLQRITLHEITGESRVDPQDIHAIEILVPAPKKP